jgi:hypothetical protein
LLTQAVTGEFKFSLTSGFSPVIIVVILPSRFNGLSSQRENR